MRKLSQRVSALAPSITAGLILFSVGLTALLAYRAFEASRAQRQLTENTLRDYAGFAAFQLMNATYGRIVGQHRIVFDLISRSDRRAPPPPLGAERAAEIMRSRGQFCRCLDSVSFYYQVTFADSGIEAAASGLASERQPGEIDLRRIRDTIIAQALASRGVVRPGAPSFFAVIISQLAGRPYAFAHALTFDTTSTPVVAYGYAMPAGEFVGSSVQAVLRTQPILPGSLTRGLSVDSILAVTVRDPAGRDVHASTAKANVSRVFAATDSLDERLGRLRFEVAINPDAAGRLIIGGLPVSRLPEVLATAFVAMCLLGLLMYQFRRQEELGRLRDDFVSGVSHELRTPLAQIRLLAELFRLGRVPTEEGKERSLRIIDQEARRLSFLVDSILSFTRSQKDGGKKELARVRTDVSAEIDEIMSGFELLAQAHGAQLRARLTPGIVADVDRGALRQVLLNLLDNAVRYGPRGQTVTVSTTAAADEGNQWTLEVADEGPGIPREERERIFDPYYRMRRDAGGAVGGTGIGLAVVRRLVDEHGGRVHVVPNTADGVTAGSRFVVSLPVESPGPAGR